MKKFCSYLREHATNIINFEKKKMLLLTKEELKLYQDAINCYICGKRILKNLAKSKSYRKVKDRCHYTSKYRDTSHSICNLKFNLLNGSPVAFQDGSNYDYHFIIKGLLNESVGQFECLRENTEVQNFFSSNRKRSYKH